MLERKMGGSIKELQVDKMNPKLKEILDTIESIHLIDALSEDKRAGKLQLISHIVRDKEVQSILGDNYRINFYNNKLTIFKNTNKFEEDLIKKKIEDLHLDIRFDKVYIPGESRTIVEINTNEYESYEIISKVFNILDIK